MESIISYFMESIISYFMVDYSEEEMSAIASLFPGVHIMLFLTATSSFKGLNISFVLQIRDN